MPTSPPTPCSRCGQRATRRGKCDKHASQHDRQRGTAYERGYDGDHEFQFRQAVLEHAHWMCVGVLPDDTRCPRPALIADHFPRTRKQLIRDGDDPNDPRFGRALCKSCHDRHTASTSIARPGR